MNDPHVEALSYTMHVRKGMTYDDPPALVHETRTFRARLDDGKLRVEMLEHHPYERSARIALTPFLRAWELCSASTPHVRDFRFKFEAAEIIDRRPHVPASAVAVAPVPVARLRVTATVSSVQRVYPAPPAGFAASQVVRQLWDRYEAAIDDREPATSAGYCCYSALKNLAPPRTRNGEKIPWVSRALSIDEQVIETLGALTNKGGLVTGRKYSPKPGSHTDVEMDWMLMAIRALTRRLGEWEHDRWATRPPITMADLPPL